MAEIGIWNIHEDGTLAKLPSYRGFSGPSGHFAVAIRGFDGPFMVTASGGITSDYYDTSTAGLIRFDPEPHMRTVVLEHEAEQGQEVVLSPITTLITVLAEVRSPDESPWASEWHAEIRDLELDQVEEMHRLMSEHFLFDPASTKPSLDPISASEEELHHGLVLAGIASIASIAAECMEFQGGVQRSNTMITSAALVRDARGPERRMDGIGPEGPVPIGYCSPLEPSIMASPDTLRRDLGDALVSRFLASAANPGIDPADVRAYLEHLATNTEPGLFGEAPGDGGDGGDGIPMSRNSDE